MVFSPRAGADEALGAHNQNSALGHQNSEKQLSKQRMNYIATCKIVLIMTAQDNKAIICNYL